MTDCKFFTPEEAAAFERNGYVVVRGLYDAETMADIAAWADDIQARPETAGKWMKYFDDNLTDAARRVLYITYNRHSAGDHRARYYADKRKTFPPDIERVPDKDYKFRV